MSPNATLILRPQSPADLEALFQIQLDPESNALAGTKPRSRENFDEVWAQTLKDPKIRSRAIILDGSFVGAISCFQREGLDYVGYWIDRAHWGRGVTSRALGLFLEEERRRPLHAQVVATNPASMRVLQKHGFRETGRFVDPGSERFSPGEVVKFVLE